MPALTRLPLTVTGEILSVMWFDIVLARPTGRVARQYYRRPPDLVALDLLEGLHEFSDRLLSVAIEHPRVVPVK
jgi:hypothetical protein